MHIRVLGETSSIVSFSTAPEIIFKVKRSYFKVKFPNFANFCPFCVADYIQVQRFTHPLMADVSCALKIDPANGRMV